MTPEAPTEVMMDEATSFATAFVSIASTWKMLGDILTRAEHIDSKGENGMNMDGAIVLAVLAQNQKVNDTNELPTEVLRVAFKCVNLRKSGNASLQHDWHLPLERVRRIFLCIEETTARSRILSSQTVQSLDVVPSLATDLYETVLRAVATFYRDEFHEDAPDLDCHLISESILDKFETLEDDSDDEERGGADAATGSPETAPAA
jgi:hypothetical protein